jgi:membrane protease YdiL (CAAX protease family)
MLTKKNNYFFILLAAVLGALLALHFIPPVVALLIVVFSVMLLLYRYYLQKNKPALFYLLWFVAIILGVGIGLYRPAGFNYPLIFSVSQLYEGGLPMDLYLNLGKALAGYCIIFFLFSSARQSIGYITSLPKQISLVVVSTLLILGVAIVLLNLQVHVKAVNYILMFGAVNLLVTCVAEEAFMRWLLQTQLQIFFARKISNRILQEGLALLITTIIFVLTHMVHGLEAVMVFTLAGFVYGFVYTLTKNLLAAIAVHFLVNIIHFSLLTYPIS